MNCRFQLSNSGGPSVIATGPKFIADTADCVDQFWSKRFVDLLAQVIDIYIDDVGGCVEADVPNVLDDHVPGDATPLVPHEVLEERELLGCKFDLFPRPLDTAFYTIQFEVGDLQCGTRDRWGAS